MRIVFTLLFLCATTLWSGAAGSERHIVYQIELTNPVHEDVPPELYDVVQVLDEAGRPDQYRLQLVTDVCMEGFCKQLEVTLVWDSQGDYVGLSVVEGEPLTKRSHDLFTAQDYLRLNRILKNKQSVLGQYPLSTFVTDKTPEGIDVLGGATRKNYFDEVVPGAVYSTWVLWNWANGEVVDELRRLTAEVNQDA